MSRVARVLFFVGVTITVTATTAVAQPNILAVQSPPPNERGWTNSPAKVEFVCAQAVKCPDDTLATQEGAAQIFAVTAVGKSEQTVTETVTLNLDWTPPEISFESPIPATTADFLIAIVARTSDSLSGPLSATCNGRRATIGEGGVIRCAILLTIGANDVVVQVSDRADNSSSAGFRIVRTSSSPHLAIVPNVFGMIVGQVTTVQVHDEAGRPARGVVWHVDNRAAGDMSNDGRHVFTAKAPGTVTITASADGISTEAVVTVYAGDRLPMGSTRWAVGAVRIIQLPETQPLKPTTANSVALWRRDPGDPLMVDSVNNSTGWLNWRERPATNSGETSASIRELIAGGALVMFDQADGRSAAVRTGGPPWRYQSSGRIGPAVMQFADGGVLMLERTETDYTNLLVLDGATGRVTRREPVASGTHLVLNVSCVKGAHGVRYVPAQVGPLNPTLRVIHFGIVVTEDREDFGVCGDISGYYRRKVMIATAYDGERRVDAAATIEVAAGSAVPNIDLFEVAVDRLGARLLPWSIRDPQTGTREFRVTRFTDTGTKEFKLPAAGKLWLSGRADDIAVTTDGTRVVGFNVVTGAISYAYAYEGGIEIIGVQNGTAFINHQGKQVKLEVPSGPQH